MMLSIGMGFTISYTYFATLISGKSVLNFHHQVVKSQGQTNLEQNLSADEREMYEGTPSEETAIE